MKPPNPQQSFCHHLPALLTAIVGVLIASSSAVYADQWFAFKATALLPVEVEIPNPKDPGGTIVKKISFGGKQLVNLALGRDLDTPLDAKTEVLCVGVNHTDSTKTRLIVFNPATQTRTATILTLAAGGSVSVNTALKTTTDDEKGNGLAPGSILATTLGTPLQNGLQATDICLSASGGWTRTPNGPMCTIAGTGIIGDFKAKLDGVQFDGLIIKGMFKASGKSIAPPPGYFE